MYHPLILTGFEPFGGSLVNPSAAVVDALRSQYPGHILPVAYDEAACAVHRIIENEQPRFLLHLGQAGSETLRVERVAHNRAHATVADNTGCIKTNACIIPNGDELLTTRCDITRLLATLNAPDTYTASDDAGTYVCNTVYYHSLMAMQGNALFVHLPFLPGQLSTHTGMSVQKMADAVLALIALLP